MVKCWIWGTIVFCILLLPGFAFACPVCYGNTESPMVEGMNMAILVLLGFIGSVLGGFIVFFLCLRHRAKIYQQRLRQFKVIH